PGRGLTDDSNSQYALLGLHAGRQAGANVARPVWESIYHYYQRNQEPDGGWVYSHDYNTGRGPSLTMTVAGLCGLAIAAEELNADSRHLRADGSDPSCGVYPEDEPMAKARRWLAGDGGRFRFAQRDDTFYNVYGIER